MNKKVFHTLEFDKVRERLSEFAFSERGKSLCRSLLPLSSVEEIELKQKETEDALSRILKYGSLSFSGVYDVGEALRFAESGGVLTPGELLNIASFLNVTKEVRSYGDRPDDPDYVPDSLNDRFLCLVSIDHLSAEIRRSIIDSETIADDASSELKTIRRKIRDTQSRIHSSLSGLISGRLSEYLMDRVIVTRNNRYCVPVKSEYKSQVPGIVHDRSGTGSTFFIEPQSVVEMNNLIRELETDEREEIQAILRNLSSEVGENSDIISADFSIISELEFIFAKASYALDLNATRPAINPGGIINLKSARHPLIDKEKIVPVDLRLGETFDLLVITGPNTGGKTVSLKTLGLLELMGLSGLHIPASSGSVLSFFKEVYADIGDEQSIEQSLSTFSSHMTNIVKILSEANIMSLCLFDELCAGTDPTEGAALAMAVLGYLHKRSIRTAATTHYPELKQYALSTPWVENACLEFDVESLRPTYRLMIGVPGRSNAFAISERLGLPKKLIEDAKSRIDEEDERFEHVLSNLEENRVALEKKQREISEIKEEIDRTQRELDEGTRKLNDSKEKILSKAREEARDILKNAKAAADQAIRDLQRYADPDTIKAAEKVRTALRESLNETQSSGPLISPSLSPVPEKDRPKGNLLPKQIFTGMQVRVISSNLKGTVQSLPDKNNNVTVQCGIIKYSVNISDLQSEEKGRASGSFSGNSRSIHPEINLIGMNSDDAKEALSSYLDDAFMSHLPSVRIVHGKGSGVLRDAVRSYLKSCKYVKEYHQGEYGEGDAGVTVAVFKTK